MVPSVLIVDARHSIVFNQTGYIQSLLRCEEPFYFAKFRLWLHTHNANIVPQTYIHDQVRFKVEHLSQWGVQYMLPNPVCLLWAQFGHSHMKSCSQDSSGNATKLAYHRALWGSEGAGLLLVVADMPLTCTVVTNWFCLGLCYISMWWLACFSNNDEALACWIGQILVWHHSCFMLVDFRSQH